MGKIKSNEYSNGGLLLLILDCNCIFEINTNLTILKDISFFLDKKRNKKIKYRYFKS